MLYVINKGYIGKTDISEQVYEAQLAVLREIELDANLRVDVLSYNGGGIPESITNKVNERMPDYLECVGDICDLALVCPAPEGVPLEKDIYSQAVAISAEGSAYGPKQLKLFCWTSE